MRIVLIASMVLGVSTASPGQKPEKAKEPMKSAKDLKLGGAVIKPRGFVLPVSTQWIYSDGQQLFLVIRKRVGDETVEETYEVQVPIRNPDGSITVKKVTRTRQVPKTETSLRKTTAAHHFMTLDGKELDPATIASKTPKDGRLVVLLHRFQRVPEEWKRILKPDTIIMQVRQEPNARR